MFFSIFKFVYSFRLLVLIVGKRLKNVIVIGTTNRPDLIDRALLRPGRFDKLIEIPRPTEQGLIEIFKPSLAAAAI